MALVLEIEYLLGVAFAARGPDSAAPDWPPQPDRVFSALVATWAARGERPEERTALEWLERQPAPLIEASEADARPAPLSFVPPNDKLQATGNPAWRSRQPRRFPAALPHQPVVRLIWPQDEDAPVGTLDAMVRDVAYVGHSASLTRCRFLNGEAADGAHPARRRIYRDRLKELEAAFLAHRRPSPGEVVVPPRSAPAEETNSFSSDWLTFEIVGGSLDLRAAAIACKGLIKTLMSGYEATAGGDAIPAWVSGHEADGTPGRDAHLAAVPLAFTGFEHADGSLLGLALVPPRGRGDLLSDAGFREAIRHLTTVVDGDHKRWVLSLKLGPHGTLDLALVLETELKSVDPRRYTRAARLWATVTPLVLDRHLKAGSGAAIQAEMETLVADACERSAGVRPARVVANKHAAVSGVPSAYPSGKAPPWTGWRLPEHLGTRRLVHAVIAFDEPVPGPLLIGAGRFCGLGLCLPLDRKAR